MPIFLCIRIEFISHSLFALPLLCHPPLSPSTHLLTPPPLLSRFNSFTLPSSLLVYCDMLFAQTPHSPCPICQPPPKPSHPQVYCKKHPPPKKKTERGREEPTQHEGSSFQDCCQKAVTFTDLFANNEGGMCTRFVKTQP